MEREFVIVKGWKHCIEHNDTLDLCDFRFGITDISEDIEGLESVHGLRRLIFGSHQIKEINGLENLTNLTYLDLSANQIKELKGLENLSKLKT
jgi:Leucine-rich repeat (LRR) protein